MEVSLDGVERRAVRFESRDQPSNCLRESRRGRVEWGALLWSQRGAFWLSVRSRVEASSVERDGRLGGVMVRM